MLGGLIRGILERREKSDEVLKQKVERGVLYSSGLIAGEGIMGILIAALVAANIDIGIGNNVLGQWGGLVLFLIMMYTLIGKSFKKVELE